MAGRKPIEMKVGVMAAPETMGPLSWEPQVGSVWRYGEQQVVVRDSGHDDEGRWVKVRVGDHRKLSTIETAWFRENLVQVG